MLLARPILLTLFTLVSVLSIAQIPKHLINEVTDETFSPQAFTSSTKPINQRVGVYGFGESEGEWELVILQQGDSIIIQIWNSIWATNRHTKEQYWQRQCKTYNNVLVQGNKFFFGKYSGLFAEYKYANKIKNALLLFSDPIQGSNYGKDSAEVGTYSTSIDTFFDNKERYQLSINVQPDSFFKVKTKDELKVMRNTIYANYGLIFQPGGEMDKYFKKKDWYSPYLKDVSNCLTNIEKKNIQTIIRFEQQGAQ